MKKFGLVEIIIVLCLLILEEQMKNFSLAGGKDEDF